MLQTGRALFVTLCCLAPCLGGDWSHWRGPHDNGTAVGSGYPLEWAEDAHVVWRAPLPGPGASTPIVVDGGIFLTAADEGKNALMRYDLQGEEVWRRHVNEIADAKHRKATPCNSSPVSDGRHVVAYFKSGDLACFRLNGDLVWQKNLQEEYGANTLWWDLGTTPLLEDGRVIVTCQQTGPSYLAAFDVETGDLVWKQSRQFPAPEEANQSYTTPAVMQVGDHKLLVIVGADHITAHRLADGEEVWRVGDLNPEQNAYFRSIASPVVAGDLLVAPYARGTTLTAVRPDGQGDVTDTHVAWQLEGHSADVPTPAFHDDKVYVLGDRGEVFCLDANSGEEVWSQQLEKSRTAFSSSPIIAEGRLYAVREDGITFVLDAVSGELLARNELPGLTVATPVFIDGKILLRSVEALYLIGA